MIYIIVRSGAHQVYDQLHAAFRDRANVIWDRRRRGPADAPFLERRQPPPISWTALGFVVIDRKER